MTITKIINNEWINPTINAVRILICMDFGLTPGFVS